MYVIYISLVLSINFYYAFMATTDSIDPDQVASLEACWSRFTLFSGRIYPVLVIHINLALDWFHMLYFIQELGSKLHLT